MCGARLGSHTIIKEIGRGGLGIVYLAEDKAAKTVEALKILHPELLANKANLERFKREMENNRILFHPNIVRLKTCETGGAIAYYTMEYCNGGSTRDMFEKRNAVLPLDEAMRIITQALSGLDYAHNIEIQNIKLRDGSVGKGRGLVHRDIKPENLLIHRTENSFTIKIADFGLSKAYQLAGLYGNTQTGSVGGSLPFLSRQQLINYKYSKPEVDIWSVAAVFYFLLTGANPRNSEGEKNPFNAVLRNDPIPIRKRSPAIPKKIADILDRALDDKSSLHYKRAIYLKRDLEKAFWSDKQGRDLLSVTER